jgi:hypothetical protein
LVPPGLPHHRGQLVRQPLGILSAGRRPAERVIQLAEGRRGRNIRLRLLGLLRQAAEPIWETSVESERGA